MADLTADKKFKVLCEISRAQHFAWREAVKELGSEAEAAAAVLRMWEVTGVQTAQAYVKRLDPAKPVAPQFATSIVWSSDCMGEDAVVEPGAEADKDEAFVRHHDCPWFHWHKKTGLLAEDQPGCDAWFRSAIAEVNRVLGTKLRFETLSSLPAGGSCCLRRIWTER